MPEVDGLNAGYATTILEQYLENPESVPSEWRALFESGESELFSELPGLARLLEAMRQNGGNGGSAVAAQASPWAARLAGPRVCPGGEGEGDDMTVGSTEVTRERRCRLCRRWSGA